MKLGHGSWWPLPRLRRSCQHGHATEACTTPHRTQLFGPDTALLLDTHQGYGGGIEKRKILQNASWRMHLWRDNKKERRRKNEQLNTKGELEKKEAKRRIRGWRRKKKGRDS